MYDTMRWSIPQKSDLLNNRIALKRFPLGIVGRSKNHIGQPFFKRRIVIKLFEKFHVIGHYAKHD